MNTTTIHPAEVYLRNPNNPSSLYVKINGKRRRLFINRQEGVIGIIAERKKRKKAIGFMIGHPFRLFIIRPVRMIKKPSEKKY